jgi:hypothetical protein
MSRDIKTAGVGIVRSQPCFYCQAHAGRDDPDARIAYPTTPANISGNAASSIWMPLFKREMEFEHPGDLVGSR